VRSRGGEQPPADPDPQPRSIRASVASLLRGRRPAAPAEAVPVDRSAVLELPGAGLSKIGGESLVEIRQDLEKLSPGEDLAADLSAGLDRLSRAPAEDVYAGLRPALGARLADLAVLDLETTGFWGCPIFLVGVMHLEDGRLVTRQLLACDYPEEAALLRAGASLLRGRKLLVTFNGKSYDVPCFAERCSMFGVHTGLRRQRHVDVLHAARRRWRGELEDCRLQTLEREVTRLVRSGDVPSAEIPGIYHDFAASGDPAELEPVLHHGRVDLLTTARLLARLAHEPPSPVCRPRRRARRSVEPEAGG
jgi:uncharacterized protein YprB with RNaseH-like and TPR domain